MGYYKIIEIMLFFIGAFLSLLRKYSAHAATLAAIAGGTSSNSISVNTVSINTVRCNIYGHSDSGEGQREMKSQVAMPS